MIDERLIKFVGNFEGCRLTAYLDAGGVWTIGYGQTGLRGIQGMTITQEQADAYLAVSLRKAEDAVRRYTEVELTDYQQAALTSLVFNIGVGAYRKSTLLRKLNAGDYNGAALEFTRWNKVNGKPLMGLIKRRAAEQHLFQSGWR